MIVAGRLVRLLHKTLAVDGLRRDKQRGCTLRTLSRVVRAKPSIV
jgi:hypothetical protein